MRLARRKEGMGMTEVNASAEDGEDARDLDAKSPCPICGGRGTYHDGVMAMYCRCLAGVLRRIDEHNVI